LLSPFPTELTVSISDVVVDLADQDPSKCSLRLTALNDVHVVDTPFVLPTAVADRLQLTWPGEVFAPFESRKLSTALKRSKVSLEVGHRSGISIGRCFLYLHDLATGPTRQDHFLYNGNFIGGRIRFTATVNQLSLVRLWLCSPSFRFHPDLLRSLPPGPFLFRATLRGAALGPDVPAPALVYQFGADFTHDWVLEVKTCVRRLLGQPPFPSSGASLLLEVCQGTAVLLSGEVPVGSAPFLHQRPTDFECTLTRPGSHADGGVFKASLRYDNLPRFIQMSEGVHREDGITGGGYGVDPSLPIAPLCRTRYAEE